MELKVKRIARKDKYTIGRLFIDGTRFCDTIEDKDRGLKQSMSLQEIKSKKVYKETAIPTGKYKVTLNVVSPKFSNNIFYKTYSNGSRVPRVLDVKGFDGILIHCGNTAEDSAGCIIVGQNKQVGKVLNSKTTFQLLYHKLTEAKNKGEGITLTIE